MRQYRPASGAIDTHATSAESAIARGHADAVSFGLPFIANPDRSQRLFENAPLNSTDRNTFYGGDGRGYVDYPTQQS